MARQKRVYEDGYRPKIAYWQGQLEIALSKVDEVEVERAMAKLKYFKGRQAQLDEA